jgi:hypothetical protein
MMMIEDSMLSVLGKADGFDFGNHRRTVNRVERDDTRHEILTYIGLELYAMIQGYARRIIIAF